MHPNCAVSVPPGYKPAWWKAFTASPCIATLDYNAKRIFLFAFSLTAILTNINMYARLRHYRQQQAGHRYESFVAGTLRQDGWIVDENGRNGINDHGIDLIASKDGIRRYIQCKGWKRHKFIHEDVVSQLYGSVAAFEGTENTDGVERYIYSPAQLDNVAASTAERLHIRFERLDFPAWHHRYGHRYHRQRRNEQKQTY